MIVDGEIRQLILERVSAGVIREKSVKKGMEILRESGLQKVRMGVTTIEEVMRVAQEGM
jgi:type II secretory ATPase GspE/PulE/Tfp pilus assembly ATPase PilB-like protein